MIPEQDSRHSSVHWYWRAPDLAVCTVRCCPYAVEAVVLIVASAATDQRQRRAVDLVMVHHIGPVAAPSLGLSLLVVASPRVALLLPSSVDVASRLRLLFLVAFAALFLLLPLICEVERSQNLIPIGHERLVVAVVVLLSNLIV